MGKSASRLAAQTVRVLPRKRLSRALGSLAASRAPQPVLSEVAIPPGGFRTFDDFFTRRLLDGTRVVDSDPKALVSPADGRLEDCGAITA
ncbi:MAG: phosphatidylserine decarboxylase, partial [Deltaproteobacteria bacterium]|nr:phosphatidylserine decarboxylase [Deltaproteobacteria bacterium]